MPGRAGLFSPSPRFDLQHHIHQSGWKMPETAALESRQQRDQRFTAGLLCNECERLLHQSLPKKTKENKTKQKTKLALCLMVVILTLKKTRRED